MLAYFWGADIGSAPSASKMVLHARLLRPGPPVIIQCVYGPVTETSSSTGYLLSLADLYKSQIVANPLLHLLFC